jgi:GT2 family glycosyltransferase
VADRVLAAASAYRAFSDHEAEDLVKELAPLARGKSVPVVRAVLGTLAPAYAGLVREAAADAGTPQVRALGRQVSIVVPCWNRAEWTLALLKSLQATLPDGSYELVIVDNGSTDATSRVQANPDAGVVVVRNEKNRGFAVACNQGARAASAKTLLFCNNDVVAKPGWLPPLLAALERPGTAVVGPKLVFPDGYLQHAGVAILYDPDGQGYLDGIHYLYRQQADHPVANRPGEMRAVTGAVMGVRKDVFLGLGGFDEAYWNGNEDIDFCLRAGEAGWRVWYEPASVLVHQESASGTERYRETTANRARLTKRWAAKVLDERVTEGAVVVGPFGQGGDLDDLARSLVSLADDAGVPVVTRAWPERADGWAHRLGPGQRLVLSVLPPEVTSAYVAREGQYLPGEAKVLAGREELLGTGLLGAGATVALRELAGTKSPQRGKTARRR